MGKKCKISSKIDCGGVSPPDPVDTSCDFLAAVQAANPAVVVTCLEDKGKTETMECADQDGNVFSSTTGKQNALLSWVVSQCGDPVVNTSCDFLTDVQAANPSVVVTCVEDGGKTETLECADQDGNVFSQKTGKKKVLLNWVTKDCGEPQVDTSCDFLAAVQAANTNVVVTCIEDLGKTEHMECADQDGNLLSSSTGKKKNMINWVTSQCGENGGGGGGGGDSCNCEADVAHFLNVNCIGNNVFECTNSSGSTITFKATNPNKCAKVVKKSKCATAAQSEPNKNKNNKNKNNNKNSDDGDGGLRKKEEIKQ